jgi:hypothetical protein
MPIVSINNSQDVRVREFGNSIGPDIRAEIIELIEKVYGSIPAKRQVTAAEFSMDDLKPALIVVKEVEYKWDGERLRVAMTVPGVRPPFEWLYEVSSDVGESDYFKHYLVRESDIVLAQRKVLTVIDEVEADILMSDLRAALSSLQD